MPLWLCAGVFSADGVVELNPAADVRFDAGDQVIVVAEDDSTVAFRTGPSRVYVARMAGGCTNLASGGPYALVTRQMSTNSLCHGDIAEVVDTMAHVTVGSCVFGDFVPYVRQGG